MLMMMVMQLFLDLLFCCNIVGEMERFNGNMPSDIRKMLVSSLVSFQYLGKNNAVLGLVF